MLRDRIIDVATPGVTYPHAESGFGGSTKVWHNALMEIDSQIFEEKWPFGKEVLAPYYERAYKLLSGATRADVFQAAKSLKDQLGKLGIPLPLLTQNMFIPHKRINAWNSVQLHKKVRVIEGEVTALIPDSQGAIEAVHIRSSEADEIKIFADYFVLAAGGLGSPVILQKLYESLPLSNLQNSGFNYEDHPMAVVGEMEIDRPLYKLWDYRVKTSRGVGNIRLPFSIYSNGLNVSFQIRPAHHVRNSKPKEKVLNLISDLRNFPFKIKNYWRLMMQGDIILQILSFKFGLRLPTKKYAILMIAEQPPSNYRAVWADSESCNIHRKWELDEAYISDLNKAIRDFLKKLEPITTSLDLYDDWTKNAYSSSHHSGTARISHSASEGVCDKNCQVFGISNLFVCDGSSIPGSGFVNTGLTIVALALRLSDFLSKKASNDA